VCSNGVHLPSPNSLLVLSLTGFRSGARGAVSIGIGHPDIALSALAANIPPPDDLKIEIDGVGGGASSGAQLLGTAGDPSHPFKADRPAVDAYEPRLWHRVARVTGDRAKAGRVTAIGGVSLPRHVRRNLVT
jgi:hypothetical protein